MGRASGGELSRVLVLGGWWRCCGEKNKRLSFLFAFFFSFIRTLTCLSALLVRAFLSQTPNKNRTHDPLLQARLERARRGEQQRAGQGGVCLFGYCFGEEEEEEEEEEELFEGKKLKIATRKANGGDGGGGSEEMRRSFLFSFRPFFSTITTHCTSHCKGH